MNTLIKQSAEILQNISVLNINILVIVGILTLAIAIFRADEVTFKFKDLIEIILKKS